MTKPLQKAVIVLGFGPSNRSDGGFSPRGADGSAAVRRAVKEALAAGLKELIFVTPDSLTPVETQFGDIGSGKAERVVIARQFAAGNLGQALCGIRHLLGEEPFVLLLPEDLGGNPEEDVSGRLLAAYRESGGNIVAIGDEAVLQREGSFAAIRACPAGRYLLQPAVLDALEEDSEAGLAGALLTVAEAWPVTALPTRGRGPRLQPLVPPSERPTVRGPRPVAVAAAERGNWPGSAGL
jgi:UTP-glucose-1-phosphate uridylyltransferase